MNTQRKKEQDTMTPWWNIFAKRTQKQTEEKIKNIKEWTDDKFWEGWTIQERITLTNNRIYTMKKTNGDNVVNIYLNADTSTFDIIWHNKQNSDAALAFLPYTAREIGEFYLDMPSPTKLQPNQPVWAEGDWSGWTFADITQILDNGKTREKSHAMKEMEDDSLILIRKEYDENDCVYFEIYWSSGSYSTCSITLKSPKSAKLIAETIAKYYYEQLN